MAQRVNTAQYQQNCNYTNSTLSRVVRKLGDIVTPKNMRNLQSAQLSLGFPLEPLKHSTSIIHSLSEQIDFLNSTSSIDESEEVITCNSLAKSIEATLRDVRCQGVEFGEVLVPTDLSTRVAEDISRMAEDEPCGLRGCVVYINYEDKTMCRRIGKIRCDTDTVATFEVILTLRPDTTGWLRLLSLKGCWKKFRNATIVVSSGYTLAKNKLYRTNQS